MKTMSEVEKEYIAQVLEYAMGNKTLAAEILNISRAGIYRKIKLYGLKKSKAQYYPTQGP